MVSKSTPELSRREQQISQVRRIIRIFVSCISTMNNLKTNGLSLSKFANKNSYKKNNGAHFTGSHMVMKIFWYILVCEIRFLNEKHDYINSIFLHRNTIKK